jgi:predicted dinucleotide-binding enzyme
MLDSQWVAQQIGRTVIKAFNNILAKSLLEKSVPRGTKGRIALSVGGDSLEAKAVVLRFIDDLSRLRGWCAIPFPDGRRFQAC